MAKKYVINESYFEKIDTEGKAYFLGLLYADGCNIENKGFSIALQERDGHILELLNKELDSDRPIKIKYLNLKNKNWQNQYILGVYNQKISKDLFNLGCIYKKSLTLKFPTEEQVPNYLIRHFIRGYFDGDGGMNSYINKGCHKYTLCIVSTLSFCQKLEEILKAKFGAGFNTSKRFKDKDTSTRQLRTNGCRVVLSILEWLYENSNFFIQRKRNKYLEMKKVWEELNSKPKYKLISPDGVEYLVPRGKLSEFAVAHKLNPKSLEVLIRGGNKILFGWTGHKIRYQSDAIEST